MKKKYCYIGSILIVSCTILIVLVVSFFNQQVQSGAEETSSDELQTRQMQELESDEDTDKSRAEWMQTEQVQELETGNEALSKSELESPSQLEEDTSKIVVESFFYTELTDEIKNRITGISYPDTNTSLQITYEDLAYVHVLHYDFDGQVQQGELICNRAIAQDLVEIFTELYENQYPIEKICLIDAYGGDDEASMQDNNTSCFNYRTVSGKTNLSNHSYGLAIDINPLYNPYVRTKNGKLLVSPDNGVDYADRSAEFLYKIDREDLCYKLFIEHGFTWGGSWNSVKDYQHFEKIG